MEILRNGAPSLRYNCPVCGTVFAAASTDYDIATRRCECPVCRTSVGGAVEYVPAADSTPAEEPAFEPLHILVTGALTAGTSATITDGRIDATMVISEWFVSDEAAVSGDWQLDTAAGSVTITGTIAADCWVALHFVQSIGEDGEA